MRFGAVREMHQPIAAGTALSIDVDEAGITHFEAHVVDAGSVQKVNTGVLKGFSIGGSVTHRDDLNKKVIDGLKLTEISLVDVPCNPDAVFQIAKFEEGEMPEDQLDLAKFLGEEVWDAQTALSALDAIMYLLGKESSEAGEPPEQVQALKDAAQRLKEFIASEVMEDNSLTMAADPTDLEKKGKKFSQGTKDNLDSLHKAAMDAHENLGKCMKSLADAWAEDAPEPEQKDDDVASAAAAEAITKAAGLGEELAKVQAEKDALQKSLDAISEDLKKTKDALEQAECDLKTKGAVKAVPVEKAADTQPITPGDADAPSPADPLAVMKAAQGKPISAIYNRPA